MPSHDYLEDQYRDDFNKWKVEPSKDNTAVLLNKLKPTISRALQPYGGTKNTGLYSRAKVLTANAIKTYDPTKAKLDTHVTNHLRSIRKAAVKGEHIIAAPERVLLDRRKLFAQSKALEEQLGREPSIQELSKHTGLSNKRIATLRKFVPGVAEGGFLRDADSENVGTLPGSTVPGDADTAFRRYAEFLYEDLNPRDQKIMEWSLGLYGQPIYSTAEIARQLGITSGAVSQRKARLQQQVDELQDQGLF